MFTITGIRCEYKENPLGIDVRVPRISWKLQSDERGTRQTAYQITVAEDEHFVYLLWDSGKVESEQSIHVEISGLSLISCKRYYYRVQSWNQNGFCSGWSETAYWETGLLDACDWQAEWISAPADMPLSTPEQCPIFRKSFRIDGPVKSARVYATALGLYQLELNGERIGDSYFTPGWTSYQYRLQYQTYDVTALLSASENVIGAMLGAGWYKGELGWEGKRSIYGDRLALLLQMHILLEDGRELKVLSNGDWKTAGSPILMSEIYHGETYDARLAQPGWSTVAFDDSRWTSTEVVTHSKDILVAQENVPVKIIEELRPIELLKTPKGELVIDMGQNMVGWVRFRMKGKVGREVQIQHAEVLDKEGNFYVENLRSAKQTIRYICSGAGEETFEPHFTFQGFRYIQLIGFVEDEVRLEDFTGRVLHSDMERTGYFACSDPMINQLQHNIVWGLKGNFLDVPTDCPQRNERLGWTGDAQMFIRTASYLMNAAPFFTKWLRDLQSDQTADGGVPFVVPNVLGTEGTKEFPAPLSSAAWGDAAVICPWTMYLCYGDKRILEEQYDSMKAWVEYIRNQGDHEFLWNTGFHFGDWLGLDAKPDSYVGATDKDYIATAFYAYSVSLLQKAASVLQKTEDAKAYSELYTNILQAFRDEFVTPAGRLTVATQTAQVLALMFGLLEEPAKQRAVSKLIDLLAESDFHLTTGFVGTPYLNHVLSHNGHNETAYTLLFQKDYPSWLYQVTKGATTIWEHWDGMKEDGTFWSKDMNSFNHYAYGAIGEWLYRVVAGIDMDESAPAYRRLRIRPQLGEGLEWADGQLETMYGTVRSHWLKREDGTMEIETAVPSNTTAEIFLPHASVDSVTESGVMLAETDGVTAVISTQDGVWVTAGSGNYAFQY